MPKSTSAGSRSTMATARSTASRNQSARSMRWSAGITSITPLGSRWAISMAARPMQGAVFRPQGSRTMFAAGTVGSSRAVSAAWAWFVTISVRSPPIQSAIRRTVACSNVSSPKRGKNCLGRLARLAGQNRVPLPPAMITACNISVGSNGSQVLEYQDSGSQDFGGSKNVGWATRVPLAILVRTSSASRAKRGLISTGV